MSHHDDRDVLDPRLAAAFAALRAESAEPAEPDSVAAARRAMHLAAAQRDGRSTAAVVRERLARTLTLHRLMAAGSGVAVALATVTALGWNAPAGAPLHVVQVAHEQIALALPGIDRASLDLSYAEARLTQAATGQSEADALGEAQRLLDDAHAHLPSDHADSRWQRWQEDSNRLATLREEPAGGEDQGGATPQAGPSPRSDGGEGGDGGTSTRTSTPTRSGDGGGGETGGTTESRSATTSGDGGHDGSESGGSTTSQTFSASSGGDN